MRNSKRSITNRPPLGRIVRVILPRPVAISNRFSLFFRWIPDINGLRVKSNLSWRVFLVLLPLGLTSAFGQANDPQLVCDSIGATKSKCGYAEFSGFVSSPPKFYRTTTLEVTVNIDRADGAYEHGHGTITYQYNTDTCLYSVVAAEGSFIWVDQNAVTQVDNEWSDYATFLSFSQWASNNFYGYYLTGPTSGSLISDSSTTAHDTPSLSGTDYTALSVYATRSDEYMTAMLISNTIAAVPPYPGTFTGACSAYRNLSSDETSYTVQRFKYKFTFPTATEPFVIHWVERFTPAGNGSPSDTSRCDPISIGTTETSVHEVLEPSSNGTITVEDVYVETFDVNTANVTPGATPSPSHQLQPCLYGATYPENVGVSIRACSDGANWHAILTGLNGNYSLQKRLLPNYPPDPPQQEVTGPGGNTTQQDFCDQVSELNDLGYCPGVWYMLQAVVAHEHVHELHLLPAMQTVAPQVETEVEGISVPDSGQNEQEAIAEIEASPDFSMAKDDAFRLWNDEYNRLWPPDHTPGGQCDIEEHKVVDPMVNWICPYATANNWQPPCPVCPTPTPTPPAPTASAATNVTSSGFTANWNAASGATGYLLDVSTNSSFTSYVGGYQNLDVGNTTSRSVTGLSASTTYYYRVRAYNGAGTSGNSNVITVTTLLNPPSAPTANAATNVTSSGFTGNWSSVSGASGYRLDVSTNSSFTSYVSGYQNLDVGNVTSWSVSGLSAKTTYYYRVRAYNSGGVSGNSNMISVKTKPR